MTMRVRQVPIDDVKPYPNNPRRDHDVAGIVSAIKLAGGFRQPIVVWEGDGYVMAGHGRLLAAKEMGLDKVPVHHVGADEISEDRARAWRIADNRSAEGSTWDDKLLLEELTLLDEARRREAGFDEDDLEQLRWRAAALDAPETRPEDEWQGMPEFKHEDKTAFRSIVVHLRDSEAVIEFASRIERKITDATKYVWFPEIDEVSHGRDATYVNES